MCFLRVVVVVVDRSERHVSSRTVPVSRPPLHRPNLRLWRRQGLRGRSRRTGLQWVHGMCVCASQSSPAMWRLPVPPRVENEFSHAFPRGSSDVILHMLENLARSIENLSKNAARIHKAPLRIDLITTVAQQLLTAQTEHVFFFFSVYNCTPTEFKCSSGHQCINSFYRCDGVFDCSDRSDERGCRK